MLSRLKLLFPIFAAQLLGQPIEIENSFGGISVEIATGRELLVNQSGRTRKATRADVAVSQTPELVRVEARPHDGEAVDLVVTVPFGIPLSVKTKSGDIEIVGMMRELSITTSSGAVTIAAPWDITRLDLDAQQKPARIEVPPRSNFMQSTIPIGPNVSIWRLRDRLKVDAMSYGDIEVKIEHSPKLVLKTYVPPQDWPLKPHLRAKEVADRLLAQRRQRERGKPAPRPSVASAAPNSLNPQSEALFVSDVRMVSLTVAVSDKQGRPVTDLNPREFTVEEDGLPQKVTVATTETAPFNMAILLDLSGSTSIDRGHMRAATVKLIQLAGENDRVALYALAGGMFHTITRLTTDHQSLIESVNHLPRASGGSPLWDIIALAYGEELIDHEGERNALIVISDGIDNRISNQDAPSAITADRLTNAAREMDARIYPIFLRSGERFARRWSAKARSRMETLAEITGGRLFPALSIADVEPVLPMLAEELRSVYSVAYYPGNQTFDGAWRRVKLDVARKDLAIRARPGYFAR